VDGKCILQNTSHYKLVAVPKITWRALPSSLMTKLLVVEISVVPVASIEHDFVVAHQYSIFNIDQRYTPNILQISNRLRLTI
jgi:hypothetical protein